MKLPTSLLETPLIDETHGARRDIFDILIETPIRGHSIAELRRRVDCENIGGRLRELREGWTTRKLKAAGQILWVRNHQVHPGAKGSLYMIQKVSWEQWVTLHAESVKGEELRSRQTKMWERAA